MKKFFKDLREHATKMNNCDKKEMLPLTKKKEKKYKKKCCHIYKVKFNDMFNEHEKYHRVRDHCHYT